MHFIQGDTCSCYITTKNNPLAEVDDEGKFLYTIMLKIINV